MIAFIRRLLRDSPPPPPRVIELAMRLADVEVAVDAVNSRLTDALKQINARITNAMKSAGQPAEDAPQSREDAPGPTNHQRPMVGYGHGQLPERRVRKNY